MILGLIVHALAAIVWVGGMFFAHLVLRPAALGLEPALRLPLWRRVLARFFPWVWVCIAALLVSGFGMIPSLGGMRGIGLPVHLMLGLGVVMTMLFAHLFFAPWRRFRRAVDDGDLAEGGRQIAQIRLIVTINLVLGLITAALGASSRFWG